MNANKSTDQEWMDCKEDLKKKLPDPLYRTFIHPLQHSRSDDNCIQLRAPDEKLIEHIESRYLKDIEDALKKRSIQGQVRIMGPGSVTPSPTASSGNFDSRKAILIQNQNQISFRPAPNQREKVHHLKDASFLEVSAFLQGPPGSGKSTLCREIVKEQGEERCLYTNLEGFITGFTVALKERKLESWKATIRSAKILIIDDFQFIKGTAKKTQEELRHILDSFRETGHKVLFSSDTPVSELPLQDDLMSRLDGSFHIVLDWPDRASREEILKDHVKFRQLELEETSLLRLSRMIGGDGRKLESAVHRLLVLPAAPANEQELDRVCGDLYSPDRTIGPEKILQNVAEYLQIPVSGVQGPARDRKYSLGRQITAYFCTTLLDLKLIEIAKIIGRKDHSAVVHSLARFRKLLKEDLFLQSQMEDLKKKILESN